MDVAESAAALCARGDCASMLALDADGHEGGGRSCTATSALWRHSIREGSVGGCGRPGDAAVWVPTDESESRRAAVARGHRAHPQAHGLSRSARRGCPRRMTAPPNAHQRMASVRKHEAVLRCGEGDGNGWRGLAYAASRRAGTHIHFRAPACACMGCCISWRAGVMRLADLVSSQPAAIRSEAGAPGLMVAHDSGPGQGERTAHGRGISHLTAPPREQVAKGRRPLAPPPGAPPHQGEAPSRQHRPGAGILAPPSVLDASGATRKVDLMTAHRAPRRVTASSGAGDTRMRAATPRGPGAPARDH